MTPLRGAVLDDLLSHTSGLVEALSPVAAHNGGNGWTFGVTALALRRKAWVFWISNHARQTGE